MRRSCLSLCLSVSDHFLKNASFTQDYYKGGQRGIKANQGESKGANKSSEELRGVKRSQEVSRGVKRIQEDSSQKESRGKGVQRKWSKGD